MRTLATFLMVVAAMIASAVPIPAQTVTLQADLANLGFPVDLAVTPQGSVFVSAGKNLTVVTPTGELSDLLLDDLVGYTSRIVSEASGDVVVTEGGIFSQGIFTQRVLRITPDGVATVVIDNSGDGLGHMLTNPGPLAVGVAGDVIVCGTTSNNVFRVTSSGQKQQILSQLQLPVAIDSPGGVTVDAAGNVVVGFRNTDNVFSVSPAGVVTQLMDLTGDGLGNALDDPVGICADATGSVYVAGLGSNNVFEIDADSITTQVMDATGDGTIPLIFPKDVELDDSGNLYVLASSRHVFKRTPAGVISVLFGPGGFGVGEGLVGTPSTTVAPDGTVYVVSNGSSNMYRIAPNGVITEHVQRQATMIQLTDLAVRPDGTAYLAGAGSDNVVSVAPDGSVETVLRSDELPPGTPLSSPRALVTDSAGSLYVGNYGSDNVLRLDAYPGPMPTLTEVVTAPGVEGCLQSRSTRWVSSTRRGKHPEPSCARSPAERSPPGST